MADTRQQADRRACSVASYRSKRPTTVIASISAGTIANDSYSHDPAGAHMLSTILLILSRRAHLKLAKVRQQAQAHCKFRSAGSAQHPPAA